MGRAIGAFFASILVLYGNANSCGRGWTGESGGSRTHAGQLRRSQVRDPIPRQTCDRGLGHSSSSPSHRRTERSAAKRHKRRKVAHARKPTSRRRHAAPTLADSVPSKTDSKLKQRGWLQGRAARPQEACLDRSNGDRPASCRCATGPFGPGPHAISCKKPYKTPARPPCGATPCGTQAPPPDGLRPRVAGAACPSS